MASSLLMIRLLSHNAFWINRVTNGLIRCFLWLGRWSLPVVTGILGLCCFAIFWPTGIILFGMSMAILAISTLLLLPSVAVGRIAARGGSRRDGDIAMAIFAGYVIGQFMPLFY